MKRRQKSGVGRFDVRRFWPSIRTRRRLAKRFRAIPLAVQLTVLSVVFVALFFAVNWSYQVVRKPSELFFPVSGQFYKDPAETWDAYGSLFERHSTPTMTADLLAALAQVEGSGNPVVRTYWRWSLTHEPFEIFRPASSAVGMYQITDGTFEIARRYCVHRHRVVEDGHWYDFKACWFNVLYTRTVPSHAVEMTAAYLDRGVENLLARQGVRATLAQKQTLATLMHLCGAGAASEYARRGFALAPGQTCGSHDARRYVTSVATMQRRFKALASA
ncbi:MAG TPA: lytic transglycosylase domain-containing protein [Gammaproteobacteria bacterium]|nr:lytic transglycosylase domain-containing protein [Gammaproteobacteria bacterium]